MKWPAARTKRQLFDRPGQRKLSGCATGFGAANTNLASVHTKRRCGGRLRFSQERHRHSVRRLLCTLVMH